MPGYRIRAAASPDEDLAAIRLFGNGIYNMDLDQLNKLKSRAALAKAGMRMALREGHTVVIDHGGSVVGASRIAPSPWGVRDPETGEVEHWETVAIHPDHRGKGLSEALRAEALKTSPAVVIKSRIKAGNPKSWGVAEKLGFTRLADDGDERVYVMRRPERALQSRGSGITSGAAMKKVAAARVDAALTKLAFNGAQPSEAQVAGALTLPSMSAVALPALLGAGIGGAAGGLDDDGRDVMDRIRSGAGTGAVTGLGAALGGGLGTLLGAAGGNPGVGGLTGTLGGGALAYWLARRKADENKKRRVAA